MKKLLPLLAACLVHLPSAAAEPGHACLIEPYQKIELRSSVEALIDKVLVERGAVVKKDQELVRLASGVEEAAQAAANYRARMEGQVRSAENKVAHLREKLRRREELVRQSFVSSQDRDDTQSELRIAEADLVVAKDDRELAALESRRQAELLQQRRLRSPFNGVVTERLQHPGELAQTGESARAILKLAQTHPLRVEVVLPVALYGKVVNGAKAEVVTEAPVAGRYAATVRIVDRVVDSASGTFGVRLELQNPKGDIPAGIKCRVRFAGS
jgi:RND family efflux transporter MFP subunit